MIQPDPIYPQVRQWLQEQRQANGGHLAGLAGADAGGTPWLLLLAAAAVCLVIATTRKRGVHPTRGCACHYGRL